MPGRSRGFCWHVALWRCDRSLPLLLSAHRLPISLCQPNLILTPWYHQLLHATTGPRSVDSCPTLDGWVPLCLRLSSSSLFEEDVSSILFLRMYLSLECNRDLNRKTNIEVKRPNNPKGQIYVCPYRKVVYIIFPHWQILFYITTRQLKLNSLKWVYVYMIKGRCFGL